MRKLILILLLLSCAVFAGCKEEGAPTVVPEKPVTKTVLKQQQSFIVYRAAADGTEKLLPESISIEDNGKTAPENALITLVSTKSQDAKYEDVVPAGTKVLSLKVKDGLATADFSREIAKKGQGSSQELLLSYAIVNTLTEFPEIKRVQILVEGKKVISFSGHMDLEEPLTRNTTLLPANKK